MNRETAWWHHETPSGYMNPSTETAPVACVASENHPLQHSFLNQGSGLRSRGAEERIGAPPARSVVQTDLRGDNTTEPRSQVT